MVNFEERLAARERRYAELIATLRQCEIRDIIGISNFTAGGSGDRFQGGFLSWRFPGQSVQPQHLEFLKDGVSSDEMSALMDVLRGDRIYHIRARIPAMDEPAPTSALLTEIIREVPLKEDEELKRELKRLQQPVLYEDKMYKMGTFVQCRIFGSYETEKRWNGTPVELTLNISTPEDLIPCLETAAVLWSSPRIWTEQVEQHLTDKILDLYNSNWRQKEIDPRPISADEFLRRVRPELEHIRVWDDGSFTFSYEEIAMFSNHTIEVSGNLVDGVKEADLAG